MSYIRGRERDVHRRPGARVTAVPSVHELGRAQGIVHIHPPVAENVTSVQLPLGVMASTGGFELLYTRPIMLQLAVCQAPNLRRM